MAGRHRNPPSRGGHGRHRQPPRQSRWLAPGLAAVIVLGAGGIGAHAALSDGPAAARPPVVPAPQTTTATQPTTAPLDPSASASPQSPPDRPTQHRSAHRPAFALRVVGGVSWVQVTDDSRRVLFSGLLRHGRRLVYRHGPLHVVIGNAGAVAYRRRGHLTEPAGRPRQVVRLVVASG